MSWPPFALAALMALIALPFAALAVIAFGANLDQWPHLLQFVLPRTALQTLQLLFLVALGCTLVGAGTAWITTLCRFPGRKFFTWALVLPLAIPSYIAAYGHVEFFDFSGPVQSLIRDLGGYSSGRDYWFFEIRSVLGAAFIFTTVLYPYVFLTCRVVFSMQGASALDCSRSLGAGGLRQFWQIGLPMARPAIAAGVALALMETLNDIGAVEILGVKTLSYAIFETWLNRDNLGGAVQLAILTLLVVAALVWMERKARAGRNYATASRERPPSLRLLSVRQQIACVAACTLPLLFGLGVPVYVLGTYALRRLNSLLDPQLLTATGNSLMVAVLTAFIATAIAYAVLQYARLAKSPAISTMGRLASLGYAVPGTVLAVGLLIPMAGFDNWFDGLMRAWFGVSTGLLFSGSVAVIIYACTLRFLAIAYGTMEAGFARISPSIDMAAQALGRTPAQLALQVHRPILNRAMGAAFLLVFVDTMKELSATILLRPFDFETLATLVYNRASQAAVEDASIAALIIVAIGCVPIVFLSRLAEQR